jgi:hypothetical protein
VTLHPGLETKAAGRPSIEESARSTELQADIRLFINPCTLQNSAKRISVILAIATLTYCAWTTCFRNNSGSTRRDSFAEMLQSVVANGHSFAECQEILRQSEYPAGVSSPPVETEAQLPLCRHCPRPRFQDLLQVVS